MIEVFTTNIPDCKKAKEIMDKLNIEFPNSQIHFDMEEEITNYPCTHSILRFEDSYVPSAVIRRLVQGEGYSCDVLLDKVCNS